MFVLWISCLKATLEKIEFLVRFILTTLTLIEGLIASSLIFLLCRIIFHAPYSSRFFLMLKRDGKWQLPVIYNRQTSSGNKITLDWHKHKHPPKQFSLENFFFFHYSLWLFYTSVCCFLLLTSQEPTIKFSNQNVFKRKKEKKVETTFLCCSIIAVEMRDENESGEEATEEKTRTDNKNLKFNSPIL